MTADYLCASAMVSVLGYRTRVLWPAERRDAQRLLHQVYCVEDGWRPYPDNPSGERIEGDRLVEDLDAGARWIGAFHKGALIGVLRILHPADTLSIALYSGQPRFSGPEMRRTAEFGRLAIQRAHRARGAFLSIAIESYYQVTKSGLDSVVTAPSPRLAGFLTRILRWEPWGEPFRYHPDDPYAVVPIRKRHRPGGMVEIAARGLSVATQFTLKEMLRWPGPTKDHATDNDAAYRHGANGPL